MPVRVQIRDINVLQRRLNDLRQAPESVLQRTMNDAKERVPGWVATEVAKQYGVSKDEITGQKIGKLRVQGQSIRELKFHYSGRMLTPTHFKMSPAAPSGGAYTLKATIIKGQRSTLGKVKKLTKKQRRNIGRNYRRQGTQSSDHSPIMLMHTGNSREGGTDYIPFQRKRTARDSIEAIKAISLPQMITGERASPNIDRAIDEKLGKRLAHHLQQMTR